MSKRRKKQSIASRGETEALPAHDSIASAPLPPAQQSSVPFPAAPRLNRKLIAAIAAAAALIGWITAVSQPSRYRATALASIAPVPAGLGAYGVIRGVDVLERRTVVSTVTALAATPATRARVAAGEGFTIEALMLPGTNLVRVIVEGPDAARAAAIANRIPPVVHEQTLAMFRHYGVATISPAAVPATAFFPRPGRAAVTGILIGLFAGSLISYFVSGSSQPLLPSSSGDRFAARASATSIIEDGGQIDDRVR